MCLKSKQNTSVLPPSPEREDLSAPVYSPGLELPLVEAQLSCFAAFSPNCLSPASLQQPASGLRFYTDLRFGAGSLVGPGASGPWTGECQNCTEPWCQLSPPFYSTHSANIYRGLTCVPGPGERAANKAAAPRPPGGRAENQHTELLRV